MRRHIAALLGLALMGGLIVVGPRAHALSCEPLCEAGGTILGSDWQPGEDLIWKGRFTGVEQVGIPGLRNPPKVRNYAFEATGTLQNVNGVLIGSGQLKIFSAHTTYTMSFTLAGGGNPAGCSGGPGCGAGGAEWVGAGGTGIFVDDGLVVGSVALTSS